MPEDHALSSNENQRERRLFFALDDTGEGTLDPSALKRALTHAGLEVGDTRLEAVFSAIDSLGDTRIDFPTFVQLIAPAGLLFERALQQSLAIADFSHFRRNLERMFDEVAKNEGGEQANYIPPLARVNPDQFGVAAVTVDGQTLCLGDARVDFSIQSTCKPFNYCFALEELGEETVHQHIGREPSGRRFNAYALQQDNRPHNPMINAGAIMCASLVKRELPLHRRFEHVLSAWSSLTGGTPPRFNAYMAQEEARTGDRNRALAYMMKNEGSFPGGTDAEDHQIRSALDLYFQTCSLELNAQEMAVAAATLANGGICPLTQERVLSRDTVRNCLSLMYSCGMYDYSGDFAFSIGLPAKSGVGGAVLLVVPGIMGLCSWSPRLDDIGNSVRGVELARRLASVYRLHLYDAAAPSSDRFDLGVSPARQKARLVSQALWAASTGDLRTLRRLRYEESVDQMGDYDKRTPLHLAAAEGHLDVVEFLLGQGVSADLTDRWGGHPYDDAVSGGHTAVAERIAAAGGTAGSPNHRTDDTAPSEPSTQHGIADEMVELLWAAADNNVAGLRALVAHGVPLHAADYDSRTALHLAAAEGALEAAQYLLAHGHPTGCRDRWGSTPLDEARREDRPAVVALLSAAPATEHP